MPESGQSWQRAFRAEASQARAARLWVSTRTGHEDAPQIADELFVAVLSARPSKIQMTVSTAGARSRITASGDSVLPLHSRHGAGWPIVAALATHHGRTEDDCGAWAELPWEAP